jgi:hypothetical protein
MDLKEVGWEGIDRIPLAEDSDKLWALGNTLSNLQVS